MEIVSLAIDGLENYLLNFPNFEQMLDSFRADIICFQKIRTPY